MSFNRSGYIGRAPGDSAITIAKQYFQPTSVGKTFTFSSGYDPGLVDVYRNGIKLINVLDYAATDGSTIVLDTPVGVGSTVQVVAYKAFNLATVKATELDTTVTGTDLTLSGDFTADNITATTAFYVGSALTANAAGDVETIGIITASSFSGDGTGLSGVVGVGTLNVRTNTITVSGVSTFTGALNATSVVSSGAVSGTTGTFSGAVNVDATTDSTSTSTGALIVDGGAAIAKNVYIGAGLSVAGTLTYEDVTSVDSVGMVTAKSGVNITGGELTVGSGITMGIAGVATFSGTGDIHLLDNVRLNVGDGSDLAIYHDGNNSYIKDAGTGYLVTNADQIHINNADNSDNMIKAIGDGAVEAYYDGTKKWETTNDGTVTTGIATATVGLSIPADSKNLEIGAGNDLQLYHNGTDSYIDNVTGALQLRVNTNEKAIVGVNGGAVELYYANSKKFETTNDGTVTTGIGTFIGHIQFSGTTSALTNISQPIITRSGSSSGSYPFDGYGHLILQTRGDGTNRDIVFATGSSGANKTIINSAGKCGIGTTNPQQQLHVEATSGDSYVQIDTNSNGGILLDVQGTQRGVFATDSAFSGNLINTAIGAKNDLRIRTGGSYTQRLIIGEAGISTFSDTPHDDLGNLRDIPLRSVTGSAATLVLTDAGKVVSTNTTGWTVPALSWVAGNTVTLLNNSAGGLVITCSAVTTYLTSDGTTVTSKTLGARGLATLYFVSSSVAYLQGTALS